MAPSDPQKIAVELIPGFDNLGNILRGTNGIDGQMGVFIINAIGFTFMYFLHRDRKCHRDDDFSLATVKLVLKLNLLLNRLHIDDLIDLVVIEFFGKSDPRLVFPGWCPHGYGIGNYDPKLRLS